MSSPSQETPGSSFYENRSNKLVTGVSLKARMKVLDAFMALYQAVDPQGRVLDIGATSEAESVEANFLERHFPHKDRIVAAGIENAAFLEKEFPGMRFVAIEAGKKLPFRDGEFEFVFSHAVIEHVVGERERTEFFRELLRVASKAVFLTTPNRYFPIEPHTKVPFLHILWPELFYDLCQRKVLSKFYDRSNLRLLGPGEFVRLGRAVAATGDQVTLKKVRLFGVVSNLILEVRKAN